MRKLSKNRAWLEKKCLPKLTGTTLFVGIEKYTKDYHKLVKGKLHTVELNKKLAKYGSPHGHFTKNFMDFKPRRKYDNVVLFGLFGQTHSWTNKMWKIKKAHLHAHEMLKKGGNLISGHRCGVKISTIQWTAFFEDWVGGHCYLPLEIAVLDRQFIFWGGKT